MHTKVFSRSLCVALCLLEGSYARTCRPRTSSASPLSELASSTPIESVTATSTTAASTDISVSNTETTSTTDITSATDTTFTTDTESTSATEDTSVAPTSQTTSTTDFASSSTVEATSATSILTAEDTSIPPPETTSATDSATTDATTTDATTTNTVDATSTIDPNPVITSFYLKSSSQSGTFNNLPLLFEYGFGAAGVYMVPPLSSASQYHPYQLKLEDGSNKLMMNDYYLATDSSGYVTSAPVSQISANRDYITCTSPVREGLAIQCLGGTTRTDFVYQAGSLLMLDSSTWTGLPRISFIGSASQ